MSFASLLSPILVQDNRNLRLQVADGHPNPLDGRTKAAYVHPKPANGDFTSASRRIYVGSFEVSSVLLEGVRCTFASVFRFLWKGLRVLSSESCALLGVVSVGLLGDACWLWGRGREAAGASGADCGKRKWGTHFLAPHTMLSEPNIFLPNRNGINHSN